MNKIQEEYINKDFSLDDGFSLTREDYESFPCAMVAVTWTDEQMHELAQKVHNIFQHCDLDDEEEAHDFWYETIETCATEMGMKYYEDLSDEEMDEASEFWDNIK